MRNYTAGLGPSIHALHAKTMGAQHCLSINYGGKPCRTGRSVVAAVTAKDRVLCLEDAPREGVVSDCVARSIRVVLKKLLLDAPQRTRFFVCGDGPELITL
ncbi:unnamed protein product [Ectocarpus sp. 8 AP-2014]